MTLSKIDHSLSLAFRVGSLEKDMLARFKSIATQKRDVELVTTHEKLLRELAKANRAKLEDEDES